MSKTKFDVAIVGGSFAGLAVARGLVQALGPDVRLAVVDRANPAAQGAVADSRAFAIWAGTKKILEGLGAWNAIAADAEAVTSIEISDSDLDDAFRPARVTYDARTADGSPAAYIVPAAALAAALYQSVADDPSVTWFAPAEVENLTVGEHACELRLGDGSTVSAALTIAADGKNSKLRDAAGIKTVGWSYPQTGIVARVKFEEPHGGVAIQHFLPGGPFAILPLKDNRACITWSADKAEADRMTALNDEDFLAELDRAHRRAIRGDCARRATAVLAARCAASAPAHRTEVRARRRCGTWCAPDRRTGRQSRATRCCGDGRGSCRCCAPWD